MQAVELQNRQNMKQSYAVLHLSARVNKTDRPCELSDPAKRFGVL